MECLTRVDAVLPPPPANRGDSADDEGAAGGYESILTEVMVCSVGCSSSSVDGR